MSETKCCCCESDDFSNLAEMENDTILCRCEEVTLGTARKWIAEGYDTFDEIKRMLRVGMGPCQGRGCRDILLREISQITGKPVSELSPGTIRPPVKPIKVSLVARDYTGGDKK